MYPNVLAISYLWNTDDIIQMAKSVNFWQFASWRTCFIHMSKFKVAWLFLKLSKSYQTISGQPNCSHFGSDPLKWFCLKILLFGIVPSDLHIYTYETTPCGDSWSDICKSVSERYSCLVVMTDQILSAHWWVMWPLNTGDLKWKH